jgi:hypothetical protein
MRETIEIVKCDLCGKETEKREYRGSLKAEHVCMECFEKHLFGGLAMERPTRIEQD